MKTRADFFKDCKDKHLALETTINNSWGNNLPERLKGIRKITTVRTNSVVLEKTMADGSVLKSIFELPRANLMDYDGETLSIYSQGIRTPNTQEQKALDEWKEHTKTKEYKDDAETDAYTDTHLCFYSKKGFFSSKNMLYLMGYEKERGMKLDCNYRPENPGDPEYLIFDENIRGKLLFKYKIYNLDLEKTNEQPDDELEM